MLRRRVQNREDGKYEEAHGIRRKSTISKSEVRVTIAVIWLRFFAFFAFELVDDVSNARPQVMESSTSTGSFPPFDCTSISLIAKVYWGRSFTEARTSLPNGGRRLRSCPQMLQRDRKDDGCNVYRFDSVRFLLAQKRERSDPVLRKHLCDCH